MTNICDGDQVKANCPQETDCSFNPASKYSYYCHCKTGYTKTGTDSTRPNIDSCELPPTITPQETSTTSPILFIVFGVVIGVLFFLLIAAAVVILILFIRKKRNAAVPPPERQGSVRSGYENEGFARSLKDISLTIQKTPEKDEVIPAIYEYMDTQNLQQLPQVENTKEELPIPPSTPPPKNF